SEEGAGTATAFFSTAETTTSSADTDFFGFGAGATGLRASCSCTGAAIAAGGPRARFLICGSAAVERAAFSAATARFHCKRQTINPTITTAMKPAHVIRKVVQRSDGCEITSLGLSSTTLGRGGSGTGSGAKSGRRSAGGTAKAGTSSFAAVKPARRPDDSLVWRTMR